LYENPQLDASNCIKSDTSIAGLGLNSEPQNRGITNRRISKGGFASLNLYYRIDRSTLSSDPEALDGQITFLRHSIFMIRYSLFYPRKAEVSFSIKLAAFQATGFAKR